MAQLLPFPRFRALDANGDPLAGGLVYTYVAGTSTFKTTYTDATENTSNQNPVELDSEGYADIWFTGSIKVAVHDANDSLLFTVNSIQNADSALTTGNKVIGGQGVFTGEITSTGDGNIIAGGRDLEISGTADNAVSLGGDNNVVSGDCGVSLGGKNNSTNNTFGAVISGQNNTNTSSGIILSGSGCVNTGAEAAIIGASSGIASATNAAVIGGGTGTATATNSGVFVGSGNTASGARAAIIGGGNNSAAGVDSIILAGVSNTTSAAATYSSVTGLQGAATLSTQRVHSSGQFSATGDCQFNRVILRNITTTNAQTELYINGVTATQRLTIPTDTTKGFEILVTARRTDADGESARYKIEGCIDNNAGTTALVGSITKTVIAEDTAGWDVTAEADDTNDALVVKVTGENAKSIRWSARVEWDQIAG